MLVQSGFCTGYSLADVQKVVNLFFRIIWSSLTCTPAATHAEINQSGLSLNNMATVIISRQRLGFCTASQETLQNCQLLNSWLSLRKECHKYPQTNETTQAFVCCVLKLFKMWPYDGPLSVKIAKLENHLKLNTFLIEIFFNSDSLSGLLKLDLLLTSECFCQRDLKPNLKDRKVALRLQSQAPAPGVLVRQALEGNALAVVTGLLLVGTAEYW